jgi:hypothetical protein
MLARHLVFSLLFAALVFGANRALNGAFSDFDFAGAAAIVIGFCILVVTASYSWDSHERGNSSPLANSRD